MSDFFSGIEVAIGYGKNNFPMNRGSFKYKIKTQWKHRLIKSSEKNIDGQTILIFSDPITKKEYEFCLNKTSDTTTLKLSSEINPQEINRFWISVPAFEKEKIYGCGETYSKLNLKGEKVRIWVAEHQNAKRIASKILREKLTGIHPKRTLPFSEYESYFALPCFTLCRPEFKKYYFIHCPLPSFTVFDFSKKNKTTFSLQSKPQIQITEASSLPSLYEKIKNIIGLQPRIPAWVHDGAIIAIQEGNAAIDKKLNTLRHNGTKVAAVWAQDWCGCRRTGFGYQVMWNWQSDDQQYPHLREKIQEWREQGIRFLGYINPFIALEKNLYKTASEKGYCVKDKNGNDYLVTITTFPAAMVDFTNPEAWQWYKNLIKENMIGIGMAGWMADFGEYLPVDAVLFSGENPEELHNQWPAIWAKLNREAIEECGKEEEIFFFTRAGFIQTIKNSPMMWTGDQHVDWSVDDGLPSVIPAILSMGGSGIGLVHSDAGGYTTIMHMKRSEELLQRWLEMNAFSPLLRTHEGNQPANNFQVDSSRDLLLQTSLATKWHMELKPVLQKLEEEYYSKGMPVVRPIFFHFDEEQNYEERWAKTEYMLGDSILVAPVLEQGKKKRYVRFPGNGVIWKHYFTGTIYEGGTIKQVSAPIGLPAVFERI